MIATFDPKRDLVLSRTVPVSAAKIWRAWTEPEHLMPWFCPRPWRTVSCEIDLRPGGLFRTAMRGPNEGEVSGGDGCYLIVEPQRRLVWTSALGPDFRPAEVNYDCGEGAMGHFTAYLTLEPAPGGGTVYTATVVHAIEADAQKHEAMGFHHGWGAALDQLVDYANTTL